MISLLFHEIDDQRNFDKTIRELKKTYEFISADELHDCIIKKKFPNKYCHITFDDGHESFYHNAMPVLVEHKVPTTLFVSPQVIEKEENYWFQEIIKDNSTYSQLAQYFNLELKDLRNYKLGSLLKTLPVRLIYDITLKRSERSGYKNVTRNQLSEIVDSGIIEIGAHTMNHPILANETKETSDYEIKQSIADVEKLTNKQVKYFAYPNGVKGLDYSKREIQTLNNADIALTFTTEYEHISNGSGLQEIPRYEFTSNSGTKLKIKLKLLRFLKLYSYYIGNEERKQRKELYKFCNLH